MNTITPDQLKEILDKHAKYLLDQNGGECADLRHADLRDTNLRGANLIGADLDYFCLPLWCGSLDMKVDKRIAAQIAYHFCRLICDDPEVQEAQRAIRTLANQFHWVEECGKIEDPTIT